MAALVLAGAALVGGTAGAAPAGVQPTNALDISNEACEMTIVATVVSEGDYVVEIWDDGSVIASLPFTADAPGDYTVYYTVVAQPGEEAAGLGVILTDTESRLVTVDPYLVDACEAVTTTTTAVEGSTTTAAEATTTTAATEDTMETNTPAATPTAQGAAGIAAEASYTG
ncbi:MAG: hypothetical protein KF906_00960 [Actinobacteria bacterium]|nr:hypothetical protein [Actinomycetota bacterium]